MGYRFCRSRRVVRTRAPPAFTSTVMAVTSSISPASQAKPARDEAECMSGGLQQVGHQAEGAGNEFFQLVVENEAGVSVAAFADLCRE